MNKNEEKEIIIDGVDVDGCECGAKDVGYYGSRCANNPDCYYKQLQREKQKNKELIEDCKELEQRHNSAFEDFEKIKKENKKLRKTLKEVEEIAEIAHLLPCYIPDDFYEPNCRNCKDATSVNGKYCMAYGLVKILEKIKEAENENKMYY